MVKWVTAALGLVVSMAVGVGLAGAHDKAATPSVTGETSDSLLDPDVGSQADGGNAELEGTLEILHEDREDGSGRYRYFLSTHDGKRLSLEGVQHHDLLTGDRVRVRGVRSGQTLQLQTKSAESLEVLQYAPLDHTFGPQKLIVLLVNFSNDQSKPFTVSDMQYWMTFTDGFYRENSYGQTSLSVNVFGWYTLPMTNTGCDYLGIRAKADQAATAAGVNLSAYARRMYIFPYISTCGFSGAGYIGGNPSSAWINGNSGLMSIDHELGHNFGLYHSHFMSCAPAVLSSNCTTKEYGDITDTMGGGGGPFNAFQKQRLGWLGFGVSPPITKVTQSGTYPLDDYMGLGTLPKALTIQRGTTSQAFFVELRTPCPGCLAPGVFIHLSTDGAGNSSYLLDMTPATALGLGEDLAVGKSFTDSVSGVTITTASISPDQMSATIMVDMGGTGPSCTRSAPSVTGSPAQSPAVQPGTTVTYNVSVTNTDSTGCSASSFTLQATAPAGWQKSLGAPSLTINPGATLSTTLRVTSPIVPPGSYTIVGAATSSMASTLSRSTSVLYDVASGGSGTPGTFTDTFDRPDSPVLGNDWSVITGSLMIQSGEARNQATSTFSLAVQPGLMGTTQTVEASFASTNNNIAPRFGVVVRYRDPQNYYICYRQAGGSSLVRIAKVQNGVETVLKSGGVGNPALNVFSMLSCQASGSTLTFRVDGVAKLSATDGTFSTGSVGYAIASQKPGFHRADNFSAIVQ
jgi:hypothetical protein